MGSLDPSDAVLCVRVAASDSRANGGLCGSVGSSSPPVAPGSHFRATDIAPATARGKTCTQCPTQRYDLTYKSPLILGHLISQICGSFCIASRVFFNPIFCFFRWITGTL